MNNQPIGILDSGVGGLSIWKEIVGGLPHESTVYIADSKHCPYGERSEEEIYKLSKRLVQFLLQQQCKCIVLACNTITVSCLDRLRTDFPSIPIIGTVPVIKTARESSKKKIIGVLSTKRTAESKYQKTLIKKFAPDCKVVNIGTDTLVPFVENGGLNSKEVRAIIKKVVEPFLRAGIDALALGCSHFPFLKDQIQLVLGSKVLILDSGAAIARQVRRVLTQNNILLSQLKPQYSFYTTGNEDQFAIIARKLMHFDRNFLVQEVSL